jgi:AcrR family transcriptional regulator
VRPSSAAGGGLRERQKRDKTERLRRAAWELFVERGYDATSTREIAERAGVATGTLFLYARDKADLLFLVFEHRLAEAVDEAFATLPEDLPLVEQLRHLFRACFAMYAKSPAVARRFVAELPGADGPNAVRVNGLTLAFLQRVAALVERAGERGEVRRDVPPLFAAQTVFGLYFMALQSWLGGWDSLESAVETTLAGSLRLLFDGLGAPQAGRSKG